MRPCFICTESSSKPYCVVDGHEYLRCSECGLIYLDRIEDWDRLYRSYDGGFLKSLRRKLFLPVRQFHHYRKFEYSMDRARGIVAFICERVSKCESGTRFLDIGCNKGYLLAGAIEQSWDVHGVEVVPELLVPFKKRYKDFADQVIVGKAADAGAKFEDGSFDIVTAIDVIEHFEDPLKDMSTIHRLLKPGGVFVVQTPNASGERAREQGGEWGSLKPLEHLYLFNPDNLEVLAKQLGYREVSCHPPFDEALGNMVVLLQK